MTATSELRPNRLSRLPSDAEPERTTASYFRAFGPVPAWDDLLLWPPDVFALANLVLDHTQSYRFVLAPPPGRCWPPFSGWGAEVRGAAQAWRDAVHRDAELPPFLRTAWEIVRRFRDVPLDEVRSGEAWELTTALLTLNALADEACGDVASCGRRGAEPSFEGRAWTMLQRQGSLARIPPARVRIVPKTHPCARGITIRSVSRYLALSYESVDVRWTSVEPGPSANRDDYNILLVPWPLSVRADDFRPVRPALVENQMPDRVGFFEFLPELALDSELVATLVKTAAADGERVDAVVFPEAAVDPAAIEGLEQVLAEHGATFLIAGVHQPPVASNLGRNYLHFGVHTRTGWNRYEQDKHHRWCLDEAQIRQYHLSRSLHPKKLWWEAIDVRERTLNIVDVGSGITTAPLVCEDLARLDEVADVVRRIGPSLVVAVLLDGPQLRTRWPGRYASVLADDPGSAVLTLTAYGMAARSRPPGKPASRVVAHWNDGAGNVDDIELEPRAAGILLSTVVERSGLSTADGRWHSDVPKLKLCGVRQLRDGRKR